MTSFASWGNYPGHPQKGVFIKSRHANMPVGDVPVLPYGNGRSYGDSCQNSSGMLIGTRQLDKLVSFDDKNGVIRCESGVLFSEILALIVPRGWFLPVTPGTKFVTVGGAIANDVHGKNHHVAGTFGRFVNCFELVRSSGDRLLCSPNENPELFSATIGGLGLTGLVTWAEFRLTPVGGNALSVDNIRMANIDDFFRLSEDSDADFDYTVSWIDCTARGSALGRGLFSRANHADLDVRHRARKSAVPFTPPFSLVNTLSVKLFNNLYFHASSESTGKPTHYDPFFYPLDSVLKWNRLYGRRGFLQYQCVIPDERAFDAMRSILSLISRSGQGSALAVMKKCGSIESPGMLSFPLAGVSLALDFPMIKGRTMDLFRKLDDVVSDAGGRLYPAKDAHMPASLFQQSYPAWTRIAELKDPGINSEFWQRVTSEPS